MNSHICVAMKSGGGAVYCRPISVPDPPLAVGSTVSSAHLVRVQQRLTRKWPKVRCEHTFHWKKLGVFHPPMERVPPPLERWNGVSGTVERVPPRRNGGTRSAWKEPFRC